MPYFSFLLLGSYLLYTWSISVTTDTRCDLFCNRSNGFQLSALHSMAPEYLSEPFCSTRKPTMASRYVSSRISRSQTVHRKSSCFQLFWSSSLE